METFLIRALQLILSLSILVVLHELGHFAFARLFKVRVEKFYIFFNPGFSLLRAKKINGKWQFKFFSKNVPSNERPKKDAEGDIVMGEKGKPQTEPIPLSELSDDDWRKYPESTEWGIGWLPLGGYCKISGMIDESMDTSQLKSDPQPWEYRSRPVWQRMPIITGGVLVNFILAMVIYSAILFTWGKEYLPLENAKYGLHFTSVFIEQGFKNGDKILSVDGKSCADLGEVIEKILIDNAKSVTVLRGDSQILTISLPPDFPQKVLASGESNLISYRFPFVVQDVSPESPAKQAKLQPGDSIVGINGKELTIFQDVVSVLTNYRDSLIQLAYYRNGQKEQVTIQLDQTGKLGVAVCPFTEFLETEHVKYGLLASIPAGISLGWETLTSYIKQFKLVFTKEGSKQLGGFGSIGKLFPQTWNWQIFWSMTALLSVILAFMNFLPIPALDGGYVLFLLYEIFTGKKPSDKFLEQAQTIGMLLLLALLIYANGNDIYKAIFK
ncbi:MAG: RIP metalloprotease RseP [Paludibacteraceae bacterium]|nr:RIP metalloprotease RseP [Paludibacteraceae bacterium]HPL77006.1 RIP metalloprotease RseP [Paludibacteraceae bacterium]